MSSDVAWIEAVINHEETDRVPYNFMFSPVIIEALTERFHSSDLEEALRLPMRMNAPMSIKPLYADPSVYGDTIKDELRSITEGTITFLDDEMTVISINGLRVAIIGTRGVLDQPTYWQSRYVKGIRDRYTRRLKKLNTLLAKASSEAEHTILMSHYAPTVVTLDGEMRRAPSQMGSRRVEQLLKQHNPTLAIHGHAHEGLKQGLVGTTPILNVALPLHERIVLIDFPTPRGLENFIVMRPRSSFRRPET